MISKERRLELLDRVVAVMAAQGRRSVDEGNNGRCMYRTPGGARCAAGALIADEHYKPEIEGRPVYFYGTEGLPERALMASGVEPEAMSFVSSLQSIHDSAIDFEQMMEKYRDLRVRIEAES